MPKESASWSIAYTYLSPFGCLHRVENRLAVGMPDAIYCLIGVSGWIETKATVTTLTLDQVVFAESWTGAGGLCHTLMYADRIWFLYDAIGTRQLFEKQDARPLVRSSKFQLKEILRYLSPPGKRWQSVGR